MLLLLIAHVKHPSPQKTYWVSSQTEKPKASSSTASKTKSRISGSCSFCSVMFLLSPQNPPCNTQHVVILKEEITVSKSHSYMTQHAKHTLMTSCCQFPCPGTEWTPCSASPASWYCSFWESLLPWGPCSSSLPWEGSPCPLNCSWGAGCPSWFYFNNLNLIAAN